ncbi:mannose-6-phosphate isomerase type 1 [Leucobacter luti]|uniref:mannose-6-phosphate isomerase, class I n=1 Tax=Leucobacter luti TaxID=340320 RepID=UPI00104D8393|nr:mannose-6-phosphate isomerase, class I [Leucobacter luti]MCW2289878.1 mannose-6-phosphate isomerase [Leucobacter luti]TCK36047.1 mannose-6-phosphate isomerase type 1 [Leucobacter luti]
MLIFIENTPRAYAWGSMDALAEMLGTEPTGEPQAELWLGTHPGSPAHVAKATPVGQTLIDLVESDPERYGVHGGPLPFLLKVLAIGAPLSLQVHPDLDQAAAGFAAEEAAGIPRDARERNYGDANHKPELLVALSEVTALSGFRPLQDARRDLHALAAAARAADEVAGADAFEAAAARLDRAEPETMRRSFLEWAFSDDAACAAALAAFPAVLARLTPDVDVSAERLTALHELWNTHPADPGILVSLMLHLVRLAPGEALFLGARQLHAYLRGIAVEVMAASDNVLRAGLTEKHVDVAELCRVVDAAEMREPRFSSLTLRPGLTAWRPDVPDFQLLRANLCDPDGETAPNAHESAPVIEVEATHPIVLVVTVGRIRIERLATEFAEVASARRGQSLYVSAGEPIRLTGSGEVFLATVGDC